MRFFFFTLLLAEIAWTNGQSGFQTRYNKKKVTGRISHSVTFTWKFSGRFFKVTWGLANDAGDDMEKDKALVSLNVQSVDLVKPDSVSVSYRGRVNGTRTGDYSSGQASFTLFNVTKNDQRFYGCLLTPTDPGELEIADFVQLVAVGPPEITHVSGNTTVNEGESVTLNCTAVSNPPANITWTKSNEVVSFPLTISRRNEGTYRCTADNNEGKATADVFITVQYAATVFRVTTSKSESWIGQNITLKCKAIGFPTPTLTWKNPDGVNLKEVTALQDTVNVTLETDKEFGNYTCMATNDVGGNSHTVQVKQLKAPGSPNISVTAAATSLLVKWAPPASNGGSSITNYLVEIVHGSRGVIRNDTILPPSMKVEIVKLQKNTNYTVRVSAGNIVSYGKAAEIFTKTKFVGAPTTIFTMCEMQDGNISITWKQPDSNGALITKFKVYQRRGDKKEWTKIETIENNFTQEYTVINLEMGEWYEFVITATNEHGESLKKGSCARVKVPGDVPAVVTTTCNQNDGEVTLTWKQPDRNGAAITRYKVYQKKESEKNWMEITTIENNSDFTDKYVVRNLEKDKVYLFLVTATNEYGESLKKGYCKGVIVREDLKPTTEAQTGGISTVVVAGAAAAGVLLIIGVIIFGIWWKQRKSSSDDASSSGAALRSDNPYELDDDDVSAAAAAARGLQAEAGPVAEPDYAQVDVSKKKRNRQPVTDEYAQVDKSKKSKKPRKQPGELDYAELDDFRPSVQPAAAAAEAAPARPLIRRPAYEGTEYADITQFVVPQPEPTYGNVPKKDVVYSNVQGI